MHHAKIVGAALTAVALAAAGATLSASGSTDAGSIVRLSAKATGGSPVNVGPKGPSVGDQFVEHGELIDVTGHAAGRFQMVTELVSGNARRGGEQTSFTLYLAGGEVVVTGGHSTSARFTLPVVGGTGRYAGARGTMAIAPGPSESEHLTITLQG